MLDDSYPTAKGLSEALHGEKHQNHFMARCPAHDDKKASLSISEKQSKVLLYCHAGCSQSEVLDALRAQGLWPERRNMTTSGKSGAYKKIVATYDYLDEQGVLLSQAVRMAPKSFYQRRPDGKGGWINNIEDVRIVPYRLPDVLEGIALESEIFIVEGEKDADNLAKLGFRATCNAAGAGNWRADHAALLKDAQAIILPDNDGPGKKHAECIAASLNGIAASVRILNLPGLPEKGDVSDWLNAGGTADALWQLAEQAPDYAADPPLAGGETGRRSNDWGAKLPQADILIECAEHVEKFHSADDEPYVSVEIDGHVENHRVASKFFSRWLQRQFFEETGKAPNADAMRTALKQIEAEAFFEGETHPVYLRIAEHGGNIYVDLCDDEWRAVEITPRGWGIIHRPPVKFIRGKAMLPLPDPEAGGNLLELRKFVRTKNKDDFILVIAWLLGGFRADGPYPILALFGEQGSAKSTTAELLRSMADPSLAPLRTLPREERDLFITAKNSRILAFDNVSTIPDWLSDALCRLSTGGGFSTRQLFTDADEQIISATRPIILTAIEDCIERGDLADRAILVELARITEDNRRALTDLKKEFGAARPKMLGSLFTALSQGLRELPEVDRHINGLPRMADFAKFAVACELSLWRERRFMAVYKTAQSDNNEVLIDASAVASALRDYARTQHETVTHTATELLSLLNNRVSLDVKKERGWPKKANLLSGKIKRDAPALRAAGIGIEFDSVGRDADKRKVIRITPPC